jgi:hypothetical protein
MIRPFCEGSCIANTMPHSIVGSRIIAKITCCDRGYRLILSHEYVTRKEPFSPRRECSYDDARQGIGIPEDHKIVFLINGLPFAYKALLFCVF